MLGRYHVAPWGTHVDEGQVELPLALWRLLRAAYAVWRTRAPDLDVGMPSTGRTRDAFAAFDRSGAGGGRLADLAVRWPFALTAEQAKALGRLGGVAAVPGPGRQPARGVGRPGHFDRKGLPWPSACGLLDRSVGARPSRRRPSHSLLGRPYETTNHTKCHESGLGWRSSGNRIGCAPPLTSQNILLRPFRAPAATPPRTPVCRPLPSALVRGPV